MSYHSNYDGRISLSSDTLTRRQIERITGELLDATGDGWTTPETGICTIDDDPMNPAAPAILIDAEETTWYDWKEDIETLRRNLTAHGIRPDGRIYRDSNDDAEPDYERLTITPERTTAEQAWPVFPDGERWQR